MTEIMNKIPRRVLMFVGMLFGVVILYNGFLLVLNFAPELSMLPYRLTVALLGIATFRAVDDFVLTRIDTYNLLRRNAIGYALYLLGYAIIIAAALSGA